MFWRTTYFSDGVLEDTLPQNESAGHICDVVLKHLIGMKFGRGALVEGGSLVSFVLRRLGIIRVFTLFLKKTQNRKELISARVACLVVFPADFSV